MRKQASRWTALSIAAAFTWLGWSSAQAQVVSPFVGSWTEKLQINGGSPYAFSTVGLLTLNGDSTATDTVLSDYDYLPGTPGHGLWYFSGANSISVKLEKLLTGGNEQGGYEIIKGVLALTSLGFITGSGTVTVYNPSGTVAFVSPFTTTGVRLSLP